MFSNLTRRVIGTRIFCSKQDLRTFLSDAYKCQNTWEQRKQVPIFKSVDYDDLYHQLDRSFQIGHRISLLDVDIFVNGLDNPTYKNELEDVLFKLRLNPESSLMSERTMHAVIQYYISTGQKKELIDILSDRLNYGIFPDYYASNILMDSFLKDGDTISAAKVAVLQMLQEDCSHPILKSLSILSCYKYLNSSELWLQPKEPEIDPDEDEVKVRVNFIRNSYFDDHFDLVNPNHLVGKTLYFAGKSYRGPLGISCQLVGLTLYEKWSAVYDLLKDIAASNIPVHEDAIAKVIEYTQCPPKQEEGKAASEDNDDIKSVKAKIISAAGDIKKLECIIAGKLVELAEAEVKNVVSENEAKDIHNLDKLYKNWEKERNQHVEQEIFESKKRKIAAEITKTKEDLAKEEEMVFFFDNEEKWDLKVQEKEKEISELAEQQKASKKKVGEEEYIPPEVGKKSYY